MSLRLISLALSPLLIGSATAATLRVPQDYDLIQRAAWAAAPGDAIAIAEGTFFENVVVTKPLTLQGAGVGKTIIAGKDRGASVLSLNAAGGASGVQNLTLRHEPEPELPPLPSNFEGPPTEAAADGLSASNGDITLKNVAIEKPSSTGASVANAKITVENLSITSAQSAGLSLYKITRGSSITGLTVTSTAGGYDLTASDIHVVFKNLTLDGKGIGPIQISGAKTVATFPGLSAELKEKISWESGASPDGVPKEIKKPADEEGEAAEEYEMDPYSAARQARRDEHQKNSEPARRPFARDLQSALQGKSDAASHAAALGVYFKALLETYQPDETADFGVDEAIRAEVHAFHNRFGAAALVDAILAWPKYEEVNPQMSYDAFSTPIMKISVENARGANWVKANGAKLDAIFDRWKNDKSADPAARAAVFVACVHETADLLYGGDFPPENLKGALRERVLAEVNLFIAQAGYPAFSQFLRQFAGGFSNDLIAAPEIQAALTPEQKRELFKVMRGTK
jgi:hypothetical protein